MPRHCDKVNLSPPLIYSCVIISTINFGMQPRIPYLRIVSGTILVLLIIGAAGIVALTQSKIAVFDETTFTSTIKTETGKTLPAPFPVSVDVASETIEDNPTVMPYLEKYLAADTVKPIRTSWLHRLTRKLAQLDWYQNLASPLTRILVIWPGDRKEQVAKNFGDILKWKPSEREHFLELVTASEPALGEGTLFPGRYVVDVKANPTVVAEAVRTRFTTEVSARYPSSVARQVPFADALTIASLLEREAYTFSDMRLISGVIWNRLFAEKPLQLDATLQYAKADASQTGVWWPVVKPDDKFIESPYNTYANTGLPPGPIANPSATAILAALNPVATDCLYYFHDTDGTIYCSKTYEEHKGKLIELYGRGK